MVEAVTARAAALGLADKLTVITGDAVEVDFPQFDVCVANIPYGISSPLTAKLLFGPYRFRAGAAAAEGVRAAAGGHAGRRGIQPPGGQREASHGREQAGLRAHAQGGLLRRRDPAEGGRARGQPRRVAGAHARVLRTEEQDPRRHLQAEEDGHGAVQPVAEGGRACSAGGVGLGALDDDCNEETNNKDGDRSDGAVGFSDEELGSFKERIAGALEFTELASKRPSKLSNDELLRLLHLFNERGVRFQ